MSHSQNSDTSSDTDSETSSAIGQFTQDIEAIAESHKQYRKSREQKEKHVPDSESESLDLRTQSESLFRKRKQPNTEQLLADIAYSESLDLSSQTQSEIPTLHKKQPASDEFPTSSKSLRAPLCQRNPERRNPRSKK